jgi:hypothetical protein
MDNMAWHDMPQTAFCFFWIEAFYWYPHLILTRNSAFAYRASRKENILFETQSPACMSLSQRKMRMAKWHKLLNPFYLDLGKFHPPLIVASTDTDFPLWRLNRRT